MERLVSEFGFRRVCRIEHITQGIENSNFFVEASSGKGPAELVVTLFESEPQGDGFLIRLLEHLALQGLPVPMPYRNQKGDAIIECDGRAAMVVKRFPGQHPTKPTPAQCQKIGAFLGSLHVAAAPLAEAAPAHPRDLKWLRTRTDETSPLLDAKARQLLLKTLDWVSGLLSRKDVQCLPVGVVHGDLFHDNALFEGDRLTAVVDFHHASRTALLFDLAVALNDWSIDAEGIQVPELEQALVQGYEQARGLSVAERTYLGDFRLYASLCFWLSRLAQLKQRAGLEDNYLPQWRLDRLVATGVGKDPRWFERHVRQRLEPQAVASGPVS